MRRYVFPAVALVCLAGLPVAARAAGDRAATPTVVVRLESIDGLLANAQYLAALTGHEEQVKQFQGMLKSKTGDKGLEGIDAKKPLGLYGTVGTQGFDSTAVLLIPVSDEKAFLALLENVNLKAEKGQGGLYTVTSDSGPGVTGYLRFANGYAYATAALGTKENALSKDSLLDPEKVLPAGKGDTVSAVVRLDQIPDNIKQLALGQLANRLADAKEQAAAAQAQNGKEPTEAEKQLSGAVIDDFGNHLKEIVRDGKELALRVNVDRDKGELSVEMSLDGRPSTTLAKNITALGQGRSAFAGLLSQKAALQGLAHATLPEDVRKALGPVIDEGLAKALAKEQDQAKRERATEFVNALKPTLKSGDFDGAFVLYPPAGEGKHHTMVGALKLKEGDQVDKAFRDTVGSLPEKDRERIKLDAEKIGDVAVHRVDAQKDFDAKAKQTFGENNPIYLAFRKDAVFIVLGENGIGALKDVLATEGGSAPPFRLDISMARMAPAIAAEHKDEKGDVARAAQEAFGKEAGSDRVSITLEGGSQLRGRLLIEGPVLKFISLVNKAEKGEK
jgi:hypothetical protein